MSARLATVIAAAIAEGVLPPSAAASEHDERPWPVTLLTALGAWLAAIPLLIGLALLVGDILFRGAGPYLIGALSLAGAVALLRMTTLPLFVEQLGVPLLLTGGMAIGVGLFRDLPDAPASALMAALTLVVAMLIARPWLRGVLGAAACGLAMLAMGPGWHRLIPSATLFALLGVVSLWLLSQWLLGQSLLTTGQAEALAATADGWVLALLAGAAYSSGMTFLIGGSVDLFAGDFGDQGGGAYSRFGQVVSLLLATGAAAWIAKRWPSLRQPWSITAGAAMVALALLMPALGAVLLVLAVCATQGRWRLAAAAGAAAAWIVGAFYYQLAYPLAIKALIMAGAGVWFGAAAWLALRTGHAAPTVPQEAPYRAPHARLGIALCAVAVLAVANIGIWQKEMLIAQGKPVFVELAPVDPRSLMQGDYMRLAFRLPPMEAQRDAARPRAVGKVDARGIVTLARMDDGSALAPGEIAIALTPTRRGWTLVTDAWYFREGEGERLAGARYGELRVTPDGRALLVGMRGPALERLTP
jgi:uncharacterized membrane-anchored protein